MKWKPIDVYDAMKTKPKQYCVFLVAEYRHGRNYLPQTVSCDRRMGSRTITHFCELPTVPQDDGLTAVLVDNPYRER